MRAHAIGALLIAASMMLPVADATAGGMLVARFGGEHGHVTTDNPTAIYYNPAGLSLLGGTRLYLEGGFAWRGFSYIRDPRAIDNPLDEAEAAAGTPAELMDANSGEGSLSNFAATPFLGVATDLGIEGLGIGLGAFVPIGGASAYDKADAIEGHPGAVDGPQRWWAIEGTVRSVYLSAAASYRIPKLRLSLGGAFNYILSDTETIRARNASGHDHMVDLNGNLQEGRTYVQVSAQEVSVGVGAIWEALADELWLGVSWQAAPGFGESVLEGEATIVAGSAPPTSPSVELHQNMADVWRFGLRWRPAETSELRLSGNWQRWSAMEQQCVIDVAAGQKCDGTTSVVALLPRYWEDSFGLRMGGSYWTTPAVEAFFGIAFDKSAIPDHTLEPAIFDTDKVSASLGVRAELLDGLLLTLSYTQIVFFNRTIQPRGRVVEDTTEAATTANAVTESNIAAQGLQPLERNPDAAGAYQQAVGLTHVGVEVRF